MELQCKLQIAVSQGDNNKILGVFFLKIALYYTNLCTLLLLHSRAVIN